MKKFRGFEFINNVKGELEKLGFSQKDVVLKLPKRGSKYSAGYDFFVPYPIELAPGDEVKIPTFIKSYMQEGEVLKIYPRSSLGFKYHLKLANTVGIIDADYYENPDNDGHIFVKIRNEGVQTLKLQAGDAFCQGIFEKFALVDGDDFKTGDERTGGFGSTNQKNETSKKETKSKMKPDSQKNDEKMHNKTTSLHIVPYCRMENKNKYDDKILAHIPHDCILDLVIVYYFAHQKNNEIKEILITDDLLSLFGMTEQELKKKAYKNSKSLAPTTILSYAPEMYVLTNKQNKYGATNLFYDTQALVQIADEVQDNLIIFPSSIHELIVAPEYLFINDGKTVDVSSLQQIVKDVNQQEALIKKSDILSNNVYYYNKNSEKLMILMVGWIAED